MKSRRHSCIGLLFILCLAWGATTALASDYTDPVTGMEFVLIKAGSFLMGDLYGNDQYAKPPHKVTLKDYYIGIFEVTFAEYDRFCERTGREKAEDRGMGRGNRPVINVSREDAMAFADWLSREPGKTFRLPTEAEWEYAARGGRSTPFWWGSTLGVGNANCKTCGSQWDDKTTAPVGSFSANQYGLYDTVGNVYEWVLDSWVDGYDHSTADGTAYVDKHADEYVSRGGSYREVASSMPAYARNWGPPTPHDDIGFRLVMEP